MRYLTVNQLEDRGEVDGTGKLTKLYLKAKIIVLLEDNSQVRNNNAQ